MKRSTHRTLGWQTSGLRAFVVTFGFVLASAIVYAQESKPVGEDTKPAEATVDPTMPAPAKAVADSKMPDISGTWFVYDIGHVVNTAAAAKVDLENPPRNSQREERSEILIRRANDGSADFISEALLKTDDRLVRIKWSEERHRFEWVDDGDATSIYKHMMQVRADGQTARVLITETKKDIPKLNDSEAVPKAVYLQELRRTKTSELDGGGFGGGLAGPRGRMESQEILAMETIDGLAFFSKPLGKWSHLKIPRPEFDLLLNQTVVSQQLAVTRIDEAIYGFSSLTGRFAKLPIPKALRDPDKNFPILSHASAVVQLGDEVFVMTAQSGEWSSPNSPAPANNTELRAPPDPVATRSVQALPDTPAAKLLVEQLQAQESAAAAEAATIRQLQVNAQAEQNQQPIAEHQRKLKNLLSTAFDLKLQLEELQVKELHSRLSRLERQIGQRKELREKIIARRAGELIEGDALRWDSTGSAPKNLLGSSIGDSKTPATTASPATEDHAEGTPLKSDPLPSPKELRTQLEPFAKRVTAAETRVRELESTYFQNRSNAAELQQAVDELAQARTDLRAKWKVVASQVDQVGSAAKTTSTVADALQEGLKAMTKLAAEGKVTADDIKSATDAYKQASETNTAANAKYRSYSEFLKANLDVAHTNDDEPGSYLNPPASPQPGYHPDIALAWLEAATDLKLEFVQFDDLKLPFKAALRVRESSGDRQAGDLIVALYGGHRFDSRDQAVVALKPSTQAHPFVNIHNHPNTVLRGGLTGQHQRCVFNDKSWSTDYLKPGYAYEADVRLEVRVRGEGTDKAETQYVTGTCVSPDGLVVVPLASKSLVDGEPIVAFESSTGTAEPRGFFGNPGGEPIGAFESSTGTARVVGSDEKHGLTLLKLSSPQHPLFSWVKCRSGKPTTSQRLRLYNDQSTNAVDSAKPVVIAEVGQPYPKPLDGDDAFVVLTSSTPKQLDGDDALSSHNGSTLVPKRGDRLMSVENELQGLILTSTREPTDIASKKEENQRVLAIPAIHIEKLIDEFRRSTASHKPNPTTAD